MKPPLELRLSYLATCYVIKDGRREVIIRPGLKSREVDRVLSKYGAQAAVFVTAWNPHSRVLGRALNHQRQCRLQMQLGTMGLPYLRGEGRGELASCVRAERENPPGGAP